MKLEVLSGGQKGQVFAVAQEVVRIGAEVGNDLVLRDREVSREHAELRRKGDSWYVIDLGSLNGVSVNGKRIHARTEIFDGDRIACGPAEIAVHGARRGQTCPMTTKRNVGPHGEESSYLQAVAGGGASRYSLVKNRVTVGRDADNDIVIPETTVSVRHAVLERSGDEVSVIDQDSTNGTFVNGKRVNSKVLENGDTVRFDEFEFVYHGSSETVARTVPREEFAGVETKPRNVPQRGHGAKEGPFASAPAVVGRETPTQPGRHRWEEDGKGKRVWPHVAGAVAVVLAVIAVALLVKDQLGASDPTAQAAPASTEIGQVDGGGEAENEGGASAEPAAAPSESVGASTGPALAKKETEAESDQQTIQRLLLSGSHRVSLPGGISGAAAIADLTGDGVPDIVAASTGGGIVGIDGWNGELLFHAEEERTFLTTPVLHDFDGDGVPEAILTTQEGEVIVFHHSGRILWQSRDETGGRPLRGQVAVAEFTGDDVSDVVVCDQSGTIVILDGKTGFFVRKTNRPKSPVLSSPVIGPIGEDGYPSIIVASGSGMVYRIFGKSMAKIWECDISAPITASPILLDFNGDGTDDVVVGCADYSGTIVVIDGLTGREIWRDQLGSPLTASPSIVDSDSGKPVLLCPTREGLVALSLETLAPIWTFENPSNQAIRSQPALHDINGDGKADALIGVPGVGLVVVDGDDGEELARFNTGGDIVAQPVLGDFDSDGNLDIAVTDQAGWVTIITSNRHVQKNAIIS